MTLRFGRARVALIVAPHPDDETIGAWGLMQRLVRAGTRVRVLVVTDGAASHPASRAWPRARLVAERARETRRALRPLGISAGAIEMLELPDGTLPVTRVRQHRALARSVARISGLDLIVGPAHDDAHPDHRAVATMLATLPTGRARRLLYRVWPAGGQRRRDGALRLPLGTNRAAKRRAILGYRTQTGRITDDPDGFAMSRREIAAFAGPCEYFTVARR